MQDDAFSEMPEKDSDGGPRPERRGFFNFMTTHQFEKAHRAKKWPD